MSLDVAQLAALVREAEAAELEAYSATLAAVLKPSSDRAHVAELAAATRAARDETFVALRAYFEAREGDSA